MSSILQIHHGDDLYEVALSGHVIARITRYFNGSSHRQDVEYDDLPKDVQDKILQKVCQILANPYAP